MNVLFVCLANMQRSPTAEEMLRELAQDDLKVRSAGILESARKKVDEDTLRWADRIYVMTKGIKDVLEDEFPETLEGKKIRSFEILDRYGKNDPRLKQRLMEEFSKDDLLSGYVH